MPQSKERTYEWNKPTGENLTDQLNLSFMSMDSQNLTNLRENKRKNNKNNQREGRDASPEGKGPNHRGLFPGLKI